MVVSGLGVAAAARRGLLERLSDMSDQELAHAMVEAHVLAEAPRNPVNREELLARIDTAMPGIFTNTRLFDMLPRETVKGWVARAEWFDFGAIDDATLLKVAQDALPLRQHSVIWPPFPLTVFRYRQTGITAHGYDVTLVIVDLPTIAHEKLDICTENTPVTTGFMQLGFVHTRTDTTVGSVSFSRDGGRSCGTIDGQEFDIARGALSVFEGLGLMLNTKNIQKRVEEPPEKLNRARVKAGKLPLRRVTRINTAQYVRALAETERTGGHGSPRMHLRRAHLRWLRDERYSEEARQTYPRRGDNRQRRQRVGAVALRSQRSDEWISRVA